MRRRKLLFLCSAIVALKLFYGQEKNFDDNKWETETRKLTEAELSDDSNGTEAVNVKRLQSIEYGCKQLGYSKENITTDIRAHISPNHKLLYCRVNKCASTMTLEVLRQLLNCDTDCLVKVTSELKSKADASEIMNAAFSFMVVREPYGRLFSTYSNIFYFPKEDWIYRGTKIIKLTRSNISSDSLNFGHDLTFAELIKYTVEAYEKGIRLDEHVRPMHHKSCNPCLFHFDYIAHLETLKNDFDYILKTIKNKNIIDNYPQDLVTSLREWTLFGPIKHLFRTILLTKKSSISLYSIFLRAWSYYQIIGQISKHIDFPYSVNDVQNISKEDFLRTLKMSMEMSKRDEKQLSRQKHEAMLEAYSTVPIEYMERLRTVVATDCFLFGYKERPDILFDRSKLFFNRDNTHNFFKGL